MPEGEEQAPRGTRAMAVVRWALIALMAVAATAAWLRYCGVAERVNVGDARRQLYHCPMHPSVIQDHPGECPICSMTLVPIEARPQAAATRPGGDGGAHAEHVAGRFWCPMHHEMRSDDPGAHCPKCGMKMEPVPAAEPGHDAHAAGAGVPGLVPVELPAERVQLVGLRTAPVTRARVAAELRAVGYVATDEKSLARVETRYAGWVEQLLVARTGERVAKGQPLAAIYSPELYAAQQEYLSARRWAARPPEAATPGGMGEMHGSSAGLDKDARHRLELLGVAREDIEAIERAGQPLRTLKVRAPASGYISVKGAVQGIYVQPGTTLFEIANLSSVFVIADVYEYEAERVRVGQKASFETPARAGQPFLGRVDFIYPSVDPATRTLRVRLRLPNPGLKLLPGMYGNVRFSVESAEGLVVPAEAIVDTGELQYVFLARPGGRFEPRRVRVGFRASDKVQITAGVAEGDVVVTTANFLIDSESRLRAAIEGQAQGPVPPTSATPATSSTPAPAPSHAGHGGR